MKPTKELLEKIEKYPERYQIIEQNPLERLLDRDEKSYVFDQSLVGHPSNKHLVILDTETTGTNPAVDEIIELAFIVVTYNSDSFKIVSIDDMYDKFEEPSKPITEKTTQLTGITQEMVAGQRLSIDDIELHLPHEYTFIAHNAGFDRKFVDKRFPDLVKKPWADSLTEINWAGKGFKKHSLEMIMHTLGYFYTAHRAINDVLALFYAIVKSNSFEELIISANRQSLDIVISVAYDSKEVVKGFGFRWQGETKTWGKNYRTLDEWKREKEIISQRCKKFELVECKLVSAQERYA